jgi:hypothetical protein
LYYLSIENKIGLLKTMAALNTEFKENLQQESQDDQAKVPLLSSSNQYPSEGAEI